MRHPLRDRDLRFAVDPLICGVMDGAFLKDTLPAMPRLRSIHIGFRWKDEHGLSWDALEAILSASQLREVTIQTYLVCPRGAPARDMPLKNSAQLTTFRHVRYTSHSVLHEDAQRTSLAIVVGSLNLYLERLRLPSDLAPIPTLRSLPWPRLRELKLDGVWPPHLDTPLIHIISEMPVLRTLALETALPCDMERQAVWPRGSSLRFPFPELEELVVSFPHPEDQLYSHLPPTLRSLSLRCCPHHCVYVWTPDTCMCWHSPISRASELLRILSSVKLPLLRQLQLEYIADHGDAALLDTVSDSFPHLSSLEIHRFRDVDISDVSVVRR